MFQNHLFITYSPQLRILGGVCGALFMAFMLKHYAWPQWLEHSRIKEMRRKTLRNKKRVDDWKASYAQARQAHEAAVHQNETKKERANLRAKFIRTFEFEPELLATQQKYRKEIVMRLSVIKGEINRAYTKFGRSTGRGTKVVKLQKEYMDMVGLVASHNPDFGKTLPHWMIIEQLVFKNTKRISDKKPPAKAKSTKK